MKMLMKITLFCWNCIENKNHHSLQVAIDIGPEERHCGLSYVALSRVRSLGGLMLMDFSCHRLMQIGQKEAMIVRRRREADIF